jgi:hypothetical protein
MALSAPARAAELPQVQHHELPSPPLPLPSAPPRYTERDQTAEQKGDPSAGKQKETKTIWQSLISPDDPLVTLTFWLVIANFLLAGSTFVAALFTRRSVKLAERALTELERPYLVVEVTRPGIAIGAMGGYSLDTEGTEWAAINYGRTPALLIDSFPHWPIEAGPAMPYAIDPVAQRGKTFPAGCVAGPDRPYHDTVEPIADADLPKLFSADADGGEHRLFFTGYVRYGDFFGGVYLSGFCFVFEPNSERFVRIGGDAYNYNRTEKKPGTFKRAHGASLPTRPPP